MNIKIKETWTYFLGIIFIFIMLNFVISWLFKSANVLSLLSSIPAEEFLIKHLYIGIMFICSLAFEMWLIVGLVKAIENNILKVIKIIKGEKNTKQIFK